MENLKQKTKKRDNYPFGVFILIAVILVGVVGLYFLQKYSVNNKYICSYLGGMWVKKDTDPVHRCYTYEEFYK